MDMMSSKIPYIIDLDSDDFNELTLQDWVDDNDVLMNDLITSAAEILVNNKKIKTVTLLEIWMDYDLVAAIDLDRESLKDALVNNMNNWSDKEEYERAAYSRDLLSKLNKNTK